MAQSFGNFGILPEKVCEDQSLNDNNIESNPESCEEESPASLRQGKPGNTDDPEPSLVLREPEPSLEDCSTNCS